MTTLDGRQVKTFLAALNHAGSRAAMDRLAFALWTESRGYIYANDGSNSSNSPSVTPQVAAVLRRSLDLPHDKVGSNGRSTGPLQQISAEVGGGWGSMAGTMDPGISAGRFLGALEVTGDATFTGRLLTTHGSEMVTIELADPIAADVLRVQQPLVSEAQSSNYGAEQIATARQIVDLLLPAVEYRREWTRPNFLWPMHIDSEGEPS